MKSHTLKMGGEITHMTFVDTAPWSARPSYYFNNMWDFLNDAPSAENATFDPAHGRADRLPQGHASDACTRCSCRTTSRCGRT